MGKSQSQLLAVSGIIVSSTVMAFASGLMFAYIPVKLLSLDFEPWVPAMMGPMVALGGLIACYSMGPLLRLTGHARIFILNYALVIISMILLGLSNNPYFWMVARLIYGFGVTGMFVVAQSWLHASATDETRGRIITIFYVCYVLALGFGSYVLGQIEIDSNFAPLLASLAVALAILPVALTRLPQPAPPQSVSVNLKRVWEISPVGLIGMFVVGGLTMTLQSFAPIYATELGYGRGDVGLLMFLMQIGVLFVQLPMGELSDRVDRRFVLLAVSMAATVFAVFAFASSGTLSLMVLILVFAIWNGSNETLYSVSSALANDRADPEDYVMLSSTQMIAWSVSAFVVPSMVALAITFIDLRAFMPICGAMACAFGLFVAYRVTQSDYVSDDEQESFQPMTAQVAYPGDFANPDAPGPAEEADRG